MLGTACDRHCSYCLQSSNKSVANKKADIDYFCNRFIEILPEKYSLAYWGGEPMIYFEKIKKIHGELLSANKTPSHAIITTHGRGLTDEYIEFANSNSEIWTTVSAHGYDFSKDQLDKIFQLENFSFSEIITHADVKTERARQFAYKMMDMYGRFPYLWLHFVRATDTCESKYYLTKEDVDVFCNHLMNDVIPRAKLGDMYSMWLLGQLQRERLKKVILPNGAMCFNDAILSIDLHGNVYNCHHNYSTENIVDNIFSKKIFIKNNTSPNPFKYFALKECQDCKYLNECRGGCFMSNTHDIDCYLTKRLSPILDIVKRGYQCYCE